MASNGNYLSKAPTRNDDDDDRHPLSPDKVPLVPVRSPTDESLSDSYPLAAQIPVSGFTLPTFPPEASHLRSLTLTSDIKFDEYQNLLRGGEYELPNAPQSITHLTLELFSLGFPGRNPRFLSNLARALPNLKSVTFFSCLIDGLDDASRADAEAFFDLTRVLKEVHVIDSFVRPGFWPKVAKIWEERARDAKIVDDAEKSPDRSPDADGGVHVVEVSYTYRGHEDSDFLARVHGEELASLVVPGVVGAGFGLVEEAKGDEELGDGREVEEGKPKGSLAGGVLPFASDSRASAGLSKHLQSLDAAALTNLKVLNLTLWTLTAHDVGEILRRVPSANTTGLIDLTLSVLMTDGWVDALTQALAGASSAVHQLEGLEIVGVPSMTKPKGTASGPTSTDEQIDNVMDTGDAEWQSQAAGVALLDQKQAAAFGEKCPRLAKVAMSILKAKKAGVAVFVREGPDAPWKKG